MGKASMIERVPSAGKGVRDTLTPVLGFSQNSMLNNHSRYAEDVVQTHAALGLLLLSQRLPYEPSLIYSPGVLDPSRFFSYNIFRPQFCLFPLLLTHPTLLSPRTISQMFLLQKRAGLQETTAKQEKNKIQ